MALEKIVVEIGGKSTELDGTIAQLERLGIVDKKNAEQFKKSSREHQEGLKATGNEIDRIDHKMQLVAERIVAVFAVDRIMEFGAEAIKAFEDAEAASKKLEFAITKINGGTQESFKQLIEQSEQLSKSLNNLFTPKQIQGAQTQLANFGLTTDQIKKLIPQILDLSRATGTDLSSATEKAILAINGQTKGLRDVGISFKDTGSKTENLAKLMGDLSKFSGAATDSMNTLGGQAQSSANQIELLKEKIGSGLAPLWEGFEKGALQAASGVTEFYSSLLKGDTDHLLDKYIEALTLGAIKIKTTTGEEKYLNEARKLNDVQLANLLKKENAYLGIMNDQDEEYDKQIKKVTLLTQAVKERLKVDEKGTPQKIKDDLTLAGEAQAEAKRKQHEKDIEDEKKNIEAGNELWEKSQQEIHEIEQKSFHQSEIDKKKEQDNILAGEEEFAKQIAEIHEIEQKDFETAEKEKLKKAKETLDSMFEISKQFFATIEQASEMNVTAIESQQTRQQSMIETQRVLAERGLANDLAFEERRQNELEKKKQQELKKQRHLKELETFLNSVAKFSEENPHTALAKALGLLAATKAAETIFAEEGALLGSGGQSSWKGRRHASGQDIMVHAEKGEGILSRKEIGAMGGAQGFFALKSYLKSPIQERAIPSARAWDNSAVVSRLESLENTIKNKPDYKVEWDGLDYRIETMVKNGITERMKVHRPIL